jgi:lysyl-tRNA synthetase class 2
MASQRQNHPAAEGEGVLEHARREKLRRFRDEFGIEPYGRRVDGIMPLAQARALYDENINQRYERSKAAAKGDSSATIDDTRPRALVAGRCVQHRAMGKLVFLVLRDDSGDLQISVSKANVDERVFKLAEKLDYGDIVVAGGPVGATQKGEICIWADRFELHCKSLAPPPEKFHGLSDAELRYRHRYVDMYTNPQTIRTFAARSRILSQMRMFMNARGFIEVETPMMQPLAGGAAARPFVTHHNALDIDLYMRIAPELYLKRLLVGGLPRVFEINRNFRNEGVDRQHNPEFTMLETYEAFGDCWTMLDLTESLMHELATKATSSSAPGFARGSASSHPPAEPGANGSAPRLPFGDLMIDYSRPFARATYGELFERGAGFSMFDRERVRARAIDLHIENAAKLDHWLLVEHLFERFGEAQLDPARPTFVTDFPSAISPLTRPHADNPELSHRWELFIAGMELANSYTELNDPDLQLKIFTEQLAGANEEAQSFRALDHDFIHALKVGMPPAGGLGLGVDRVVMLMTNQTSIRDVILFPLLRPSEQERSA